LIFYLAGLLPFRDSIGGLKRQMFPELNWKRAEEPARHQLNRAGSKMPLHKCLGFVLTSWDKIQRCLCKWTGTKERCDAEGLGRSAWHQADVLVQEVTMDLGFSEMIVIWENFSQVRIKLMQTPIFTSSRY
jgi:hypothetical protein